MENEKDYRTFLREETSKLLEGKETEFQNMVVEHVGNKLTPTDGKVTAEMVLDTLAEEFPDVLLIVAEENYIRGYADGINENLKQQKQENE